MPKLKIFLSVVLFAALVCTCGILALGYAPTGYDRTALGTALILPISFPVVLILLVVIRMSVRQLPKNSIVNKVWQWIFFLFSGGVFVWLVIGGLIFESGHYHCECEYGFMSECDVTFPCVDRNIGILLLIVFLSGWTVLSQPHNTRSRQVNLFLIPGLVFATVCLGVFLFSAPTIDCMVPGG